MSEKFCVDPEQAEKRDRLVSSMPDAPATDEECMALALELAKEAVTHDEVPVGALIVYKGKIIATANNRRERDRIATRHAELIAIEEACRLLGGWRIPDATLYVTLEPCCMCAGAIVNSRIDRVVYGACDTRFGAIGSLIDITSIGLNHTPTVQRGVMGEECKDVLTSYFKGKRK